MHIMSLTKKKVLLYVNMVVSTCLRIRVFNQFLVPIKLETSKFSPYLF